MKHRAKIKTRAIQRFRGMRLFGSWKNKIDFQQDFIRFMAERGIYYPCFLKESSQ